MAQVDGRRQPGMAVITRGDDTSRRTHVAGEGGKATVAPVTVDRMCQVFVQLEAAARQVCERCAITPVKCQEATRFARGGAGNALPFHDDGSNATPAQKVGDRGPDHTPTADYNPHAGASFSLCRSPWRPGCRQTYWRTSSLGTLRGKPRDGAIA